MCLKGKSTELDGIGFQAWHITKTFTLSWSVVNPWNVHDCHFNVKCIYATMKLLRKQKQLRRFINEPQNFPPRRGMLHDGLVVTVNPNPIYVFFGRNVRGNADSCREWENDITGGVT